MAAADRRRRPAADPPGPPRLRDDGPDPDRGRARGPGPADGGRRRPRLRHLRQPASSSSRSPSTPTSRNASGTGRWRSSPSSASAAAWSSPPSSAPDSIARMPTNQKLPLLLPVLVLAALLALPAAAGATLAYVKDPFNPTGLSSPTTTAPARTSSSPGTTPASPRTGLGRLPARRPGSAQELKLAPVAGGAGTTLMTGLREPFYLAWSPDSKTIAALRGAELGKRKLVLIDVADRRPARRRQRLLQRLQLLARRRANSSTRKREQRKVPAAQRRLPRLRPAGAVRRRNRSRLTSDHRSLDPLWGPNEKIVFVKQLGREEAQVRRRRTSST